MTEPGMEKLRDWLKANWPTTLRPAEDHSRHIHIALDPVPNPELHFGDSVDVTDADGEQRAFYVTGVREDGSAHVAAQKPADG